MSNDGEKFEAAAEKMSAGYIYVYVLGLLYLKNCKAMKRTNAEQWPVRVVTEGDRGFKM